MAGTSMNRNTAGGVGAGIILWVLIVAMLIFTSIRTVHLLQLTFPPEQAYVAYLGLGAFDIGVLIWFFYASQKARGAAQRAVAYGMIFVCALGVILATVADFFYQADQNGVTKLPPQMVTVAIWGVIIVICLNFLAGIVAHLVDPTHIQRMKEEQLHDQIIAAAHAHMDTMTAQIAPQIAAVYAEEWKDRITADLIGKLPQARNIAINAAPVTGQVVEGSVQAPKSIPAPEPKKEVVLAQVADEKVVPSLIAGLKSVVSDLTKGRQQQAPAPTPVPTPKAATRPFKTTTAPAGGTAANGLPKKDLPQMKRRTVHHRARTTTGQQPRVKAAEGVADQTKN